MQQSLVRSDNVLDVVASSVAVVQGFWSTLFVRVP